MGFWRAKHGLSKHGILRPNWSHVLGRGETVEREEEEEDGGAKIKAKKVWNFGFLYGNQPYYEFYEICHVSLGFV